MAERKPRNKVTVAKFKEQVVMCSASLTQLATLLGVHKITLRTWMHKPSNEKYLKMFEDQKEFMISESEDVIFESIVKDKDPKWAAWYLKTMTDKYKDKKQEVELSGEVGISVKIIDKQKDEDEI